MYHLLIVEDESLVRKGMKSLVDYSTLEIDQIYEAENGEEALEILEKETIHLIFADINMPRMNGLDFAKKAKEKDRNIKIAFITGYDYFEYVLSALKIGVDDYLLKPISKSDVLELLMKLIEKRKEADRIVSLKQSADKLMKYTIVEEDNLKKVLMEEVNRNIDNQNFSLTLLAKTTGYHPAYLSTLFKKLFGMNFRDYLLEIRLEQAKILLLSTQLKSYEIAQAIGMEDSNYFSTCFKRKFNVTISEFRSSRGT